MVRNILKKQGGFTLLEVLLIIAILAVLAGVVIIALNPGKQIGETRNSQRQADVTTILNAVYQYSQDNNGALPPGISNTPTEICATSAPICKSLVDLSSVTTKSKYVTAMPKDPQCSTTCSTNGTGYKISKDATNRVTVAAPAAEQSKRISVSR
jgi:type II secretory pathway pseudopilin PulG